MCRTITPKSEQVACSRCGQVANPTDGWEHGWPLYGRVEVGFPSRLFGVLCGSAGISAEQLWWSEGHPAMTDNGAQSATFEWGNGYKYDSKERYRLCYNCQTAFIATVGEFFGIPEQARRLAEGRAGRTKEV